MFAAIVYTGWVMVMAYVAASILWERRQQRLDDEARLRSEYAAKLARRSGQRIGPR